MARAVLTFHSIDDSGSVLSYPIRQFRALVEWLARAGVPVVEFDALLGRRDGVTFTFDDGMRSVHDHALPVLREHGFPAHLFLSTGHVGAGRRWPDNGLEMLDWDQVGACSAGGIRIESHTVTHPDLRAMPAAGIVDECARADAEIERRTGRHPTLMAFPFGRFDDAVVDAVAPRYGACFTTRLAYLPAAPDLARVPRLDTFYLRDPVWWRRLLEPTTRAYIALRRSIRAVQRKT